MSTWIRTLFIASLVVLIACHRETLSPGHQDLSALLLQNEPVQRDLIFITVDTLRADATGFSQSGKVKTPLLDRLAEQGIVFEFANAHAVTTLPSHTSMFTGLNPYQHGVRDNGGFVVAEKWQTLAEILQLEGYATAAFVSAFPLDRRYGLDQGFEVYDDQISRGTSSGFTFPERNGFETVELAASWFHQQKGKPRFLWLHLFTPHFPYEPEPPFDSEYASDPYYGEAATADAQLAPFLEPFLNGEQAPALIVFTSDHGEGLGEHGEATHGTFAYQSTLHVPLVLWGPGIFKAGRTHQLTRHIDLLPTILTRLGAEVPKEVDGRDLFATTSDVSDRGHYFEALMPHINNGWAPLVGRMENRTKAIHLPRAELYDLAKDPGETQNLIREQPAVADALFQKLPPEVDLLTGRSELDPEEIARLQSLGYAAGNTQTKSAIDPKDMVAADQILKEAIAAYRAKKYPAAFKTFEKLIEDYPSFEQAYLDFSYVLQDRGRHRAAFEVLRLAQNKGLKSERLGRRTAQVLADSGQFKLAFEALEPFQESFNPATQQLLGKVFAGLDMPQKALARFQKALELDDSNPEALADIGILLLSLNQHDQSLEHFQSALSQDPNNVQALNGAGIVFALRGDARQAEQAFRTAMEISPTFIDAYVNLARVLGGQNRAKDAIAVLEQAQNYVNGPQKDQIQKLKSQLVK